MEINNKKILLYAPIYLGDFIWFTSVLDLIYSYDKNIKISLIIFEEHKKLIHSKFNIDKIITIDKKLFLHRNKIIRYLYKFFWLIDICKIVKFYNYNLIFFTIPPKIFIKTFAKLYLFKKIISLDSMFQKSKIEKRDYKYFSTIIDTAKLKNSHFIIKFQTLIRSLFPTYNMSTPILPNTKHLENKIKSIIQQTKKYKIALCTRGSTEWKFLDLNFIKDLIFKINNKYDTTFFVVGAGKIEFDDTDKLKNILPNNIDIRNMYNKTNLLELIEFIKQIDLLISIDTGTVHIAAAVGTPVISLCGYISPTHYAPISHKGIFLYSEKPSSICSDKTNHNSYIYNNMKFLIDISAEQVFNETKKILK